MRKYLLLYMVLFWLPMVARGQTITDLADIDLSGLPQPTTAKALRYWFDDDAESVQTVGGTKGTYTLDVANLIEGLHTLHYQLIDESGQAAYIGSSIFLKISGQTGGQLSVSSLRYWFDDDQTSVKTLASAGTHTLDVSALLDGLHTIHYQVKGSDGQVHYIASALFLKAGNSFGTETVKAQKLLFWFDDETIMQQADISEGTQVLDASRLIEGLHTLHYQVLCNNGQMTPSMSTLFLRVSVDAETAVAKNLRYWFDEEQTATEVEITEGVQQLDASGLIEGLHTVHYQIANSNGTLGAPASSVFLKMNYDNATATAKSIRYWFDDDAATVKVTDVANGTQTLDVSALPTGLHTLNYQLIDSNGRLSVPVTRLFLKNFDKVLADGHNRVTKYQYWLNRNSQAMQTIELPNVANPFTLITLLPMHKEPIQSSQFHFEVTSDVPTIYAKNTLHVRFYDAQDYFTDGDRPFVDYSVKQVVEPVGELQPTQTFDKVPNNSIRWYTIDAEVGDSLTFKTNQAATIQVFSPSGKEVFKTSGVESVIGDGIHTWEDGTYYLAVHDVTGSQNTITLDYGHIDKYVVLTHTPEEVGVMVGNFYVRLFGNGYNKLTKAQLVDDSNVMTAEIIQVQDISNATLQFSFAYESQPRGNYDLVLEFSDVNETQKITVEDAVTIADPIFGDITVDVTSHPTIARPYPVTVKIKNTGNVTYQFVPLYFASSINKVESIDLLNFGLQSNTNVMEAGIKTFYKMYDLFDEDSCIVIPTVIPLMNPHQDLEYQIGFVTAPNAYFNIYAWTETPWSMRDFIIQRTRQKGPRRASATNIDCEMDPCDLVSHLPNASCVCNILWANVSAIANIHGAVYQWRNNRLRSHYGQMYEDNGLDWPYADIPLRTPGDIIDQVVRECLGELAPKELARVQNAIESVLEMMRNRNPKDCPPPRRRREEPDGPIDPNDIFGYTAESGSKYLSESSNDVYYTIEFENDPEVANAAAHTIVVTDTLDTERFDLSTFAAKSIKIGEKVMELNGEKSFSKRTVDLRPEINVIAQVSLSFDEAKGIAEWKIESLDPMTLDPTEDAMQGVLPVNVNGNGQGEVFFDISLKPRMKDGDEVDNRACIVFDYEDPILTPTWTNIVDAIAPTSTILGGIQKDNETLMLRIAGEDNRSGVWRYNVYAQAGQGASWELVAENVPVDTMVNATETLVDVHIFEGIEYGFLVLATDSAGNVEHKSFEEADFRLSTVKLGDANGDGTVDALDVVLATSYYLGNDVFLNFAAADVVADGEINSLDVVAIQNIYLNTSSSVKARIPCRRHRKMKP